METHKSITVPSQYTEIINSICNEYHPSCESKITKENINWADVEFCGAMGFIKNRIKKANNEDFEIEYNWAVSLVDAVSDKYPNDGQSYPDEVERLKEFLKEQTGRS